MDTNSHFKKGSEQPTPPNDNKLRLYSMRFCPYAHRTHLVLNVKNIPHHVFNVDMSEKPEWYINNVNPSGKVPAIQLVNENNDPFLFESLAICEYLDEKFPEIKIYPTDPLEKAQTKLWIDRFGSIGGAFYRLVFEKNSEEVNEKLLSDLIAGLKAYEEELLKRGTKYFGGDRPNIFDYGIWPWFERFGVLTAVVGDKFKIDDSTFPSLAKWTAAMVTDSAVQKHYASNEIHTKFSLERPGGIPNYNILVGQS